MTALVFHFEYLGVLTRGLLGLVGRWGLTSTLAARLAMVASSLFLGVVMVLIKSLKEVNQANISLVV